MILWILLITTGYLVGWYISAIVAIRAMPKDWTERRRSEEGWFRTGLAFLWPFLLIPVSAYWIGMNDKKPSRKDRKRQELHESIERLERELS
jgi:hypothetical protein